MTNPKISIVVPSCNQEGYLEETLRSLAIQNYPSLEVIIQDGDSTDETIKIAQEFVQKSPEVFQLFVEKDNGEGHRLKLGFQKTTGTILGFLHADDTLFPGCLSSVAREISPESDRYIVMGRCIFTGAVEPYAGIEYPCQFIDHFHHLAIWKRGVSTIPQPSVFWHRTVWEERGGIDESQEPVLDYELFVRFSRRYRIHRVDELWSTYRIQSQSKIFARNDTEILELLLRASRKHWGPWSSPLRWRCEISFWLHDPKTFEKARHHARLAEVAFLKRAYWNILQHAAASFILNPKLAWKRLAMQFLVYRFHPIIETLLLRPKHRLEEAAPRYGDGWIGPNFAERVEIQSGITFLVLRIQFFRPRLLNTRIDFLIDGRRAKSLYRWKSGIFEVRLCVEQYQGNVIMLQIRSSTYFTSIYYSGTDDHRLLSLRILSLRFD